MPPPEVCGAFHYNDKWKGYWAAEFVTYVSHDWCGSRSLRVLRQKKTPVRANASQGVGSYWTECRRTTIFVHTREPLTRMSKSSRAVYRCNIRIEVQVFSFQGSLSAFTFSCISSFNVSFSHVQRNVRYSSFLSLRKRNEKIRDIEGDNPLRASSTRSERGRRWLR